MDEVDLVTAAEAARILGITRQSIQSRLNSGTLKPFKVEYRGNQRRPMFRRADIEALQNQGQPKA